MTKNKAQSGMTVSRILKVLSSLCLLFVFMPSFLVSCEGQTMKINVMTAIGGVEVYGERVVDPHPIMILCLLIPIAILVLLFIKKDTVTNEIKAISITAMGAVDLILWFLFRSTTKKYSLQIGFDFKTTIWYVLNIISLLLIIALSALVIAKFFYMDGDILLRLTGKSTSKNMEEVSNKFNEITKNVQANTTSSNYGYCMQCGSPLGKDDAFCKKCGTKVIRGDAVPPQNFNDVSAPPAAVNENNAVQPNADFTDHNNQ